MRVHEPMTMEPRFSDRELGFCVLWLLCPHLTIASVIQMVSIGDR